MNFHQAVYLSYSDTGRPAVGLKVEYWFGAHHARSEITDSRGRVGEAAPGTELRICRGRHYFLIQPIAPGGSSSQDSLRISIQPDQWPPMLQEMRSYLDQATPLGHSRFKTLSSAANRALKALASTGDIDQLVLPEKRWAPGHNDDNPQIQFGALAIGMSLCRLFTIDSGNKKSLAYHENRVERDRLHACKSGILSMLSWVQARRHPNEPGYVYRWVQSKLEGREIEDDWKAEPSLDEYSGLLMGLVWLRKLARQSTYGGGGADYEFSQTVEQRTYEVLANISSYLQGTRGWLVRPNAGDLNVRGADLVVNSYVLSVLLKGYGSSYFSNGQPLKLSSEEIEFIEKSEAFLADLDPDSHLAETYKSNIEVAKTLLEVDEGITLAQWAAPVTGIILGALGIPGSLVLAAVGAIAANVFEDKVVGIYDWRLWETMGQALGKPAGVDAGGFNAHILDRLSLAVSWSADKDSLDAFVARATRLSGGDDFGWMSFGLAARVWLGEFGKGEFPNGPKLIRRMLTDVDALLPNDETMDPGTSLRQLEGLVLGWVLVASALDIDPAVRWEEHISVRMPSALPGEITPALSKYWLILQELRMLETREQGDAYEGEEPYLWIIPLVISSTQSEVLWHLEDTIHREWSGLSEGETVSPGFIGSWTVPEGQTPQHLLLVVVAWERDFSSLVDRTACLNDTIAEISSRTASWSSGPHDVQELATEIAAALNWQLPHFHAQPEAQPGYPESDDDFVGALVHAFSVTAEDVHKQAVLSGHLRRSPKPAPKFTEIGLSGLVEFRRVTSDPTLLPPPVVQPGLPGE